MLESGGGLRRCTIGLNLRPASEHPGGNVAPPVASLCGLLTPSKRGPD
jgi:hypothetical protein